MNQSPPGSGVGSGSSSFTVSSSDRPSSGIQPPNPLGTQGGSPGGSTLPLPRQTSTHQVIPSAELNKLKMYLFEFINRRSVKDLQEFLATFRNTYPTGSIDDLRDPNGATGLHVAVSVGSNEMVDLLLDAGAVPHNGRWSDNNTPLHEAAARNFPPILKALLARSVPVKVYDLNKKQQNVLQAAREKGSDACIPMLEELMKDTPPPTKAGPKAPGGGGLAQATEMGHFTPSAMGGGGGMHGVMPPAAPMPAVALKGPLRGTLLPGVAPPAAQQQQQGGAMGFGPNAIARGGGPLLPNQQRAGGFGQPIGAPPGGIVVQPAAPVGRPSLERLPCEAVRYFTTASLDAVQGKVTVQRMIIESSNHFSVTWKHAPPVLAPSPKDPGQYMRLVVHCLRITELIFPERFISRNDALKLLQTFLKGLDTILEGSKGYFAEPSPAQFDNAEYVYKGALTQGFRLHIPGNVWAPLVSYVHCEVYHRVLRNATIDLQPDAVRLTEEAKAALLEKAHGEATKRLSKPEQFGYVTESAFDCLRGQFPTLLTHATYEGPATGDALPAVILSVYGSNTNQNDLETFYDRLGEVLWACSHTSTFLLPRKMTIIAPFVPPPNPDPHKAPCVSDQSPFFQRLSKGILPLALRITATPTAPLASPTPSAVKVGSAHATSPSSSLVQVGVQPFDARPSQQVYHQDPAIVFVQGGGSSVAMRSLGSGIVGPSMPADPSQSLLLFPGQKGGGASALKTSPTSSGVEAAFASHFPIREDDDADDLSSLMDLVRDIRSESE